jgi:ADP-heptose:LPS heptosyltransferase
LKKLPQKLLVIRFSAMGDVALCAPVIDAILEQHPNVEITFLTRPFFKPLFKSNSRLSFHFADFKKTHKGFFGLRKLYKELKVEQFDAVIDLHDVLRTQVIRRFFSLSFKPTACYVIDKGRLEKEAIVSKKKPLSPLKHTTERYLDVFSKAGLDASLNKKFCLEPKVNLDKDELAVFNEQNFIVIAPFAAHSSKEWGQKKWHSFLELFYASTLSENLSIMLLGGGANEKKSLDNWVAHFPNAKNITGLFSLDEELFLLSKAKAVVAMDSGNMHLASIVDVPVISIWGPTHPYLGFAPLYNESFIIQSNLPCRPCSVYGKLKTKEQQQCASESMQAVRTEHVFELVQILVR